MKANDYYENLRADLQDETQAAAYLDAALEDKDPRVFLLALRNVALAQGGIQALAKKTKLHRVNLNRLLSEKGNPELKSLASIFRELGFRLRVEVVARLKSSKAIGAKPRKSGIPSVARDSVSATELAVKLRKRPRLGKNEARHFARDLKEARK